MGSLGPELSLDIKITFVPKTISDLVKELSLIGDFKEKVSKLDALVGGLEEEMKKIDAFKRELPFCMLLLNDAIELLKEEKKQCVVSYEQPVFEEFIPLKENSVKEESVSVDQKEEEESKDKKNWMSSVQLWNVNEKPTDYNSFDQNQTLKIDPKINKSAKASQCGKENVFQACKSRDEAKAFLPFNGYPGLTRKEESKREEMPVPGLSLLAPGIKELREEPGSCGLKSSCSRVVSSSSPHLQWHLRTGPHSLLQQQPGRKQRRCWSPELHRRFINALHQLGGCQVATPKQIRELMQVDSLTNDEVKSHLQKYRLHMRRVPPPSPAPENQSAVVSSGLGGTEQYGDSSKATSSQSGSPQGPLQLTGTTGGDSMEDDEDAKSEDYCWKRPGRDDV